MTTPEVPRIVNPDAVGDPNQTPIVQLPGWEHDVTVTTKHSGASYAACICGWTSGAYAMRALAERAGAEHSGDATKENQ